MSKTRISLNILILLSLAGIVHAGPPLPLSTDKRATF